MAKIWEFPRGSKISSLSCLAPKVKGSRRAPKAPEKLNPQFNFHETSEFSKKKFSNLENLSGSPSIFVEVFQKFGRKSFVCANFFMPQPTHVFYEVPEGVENSPPPCPQQSGGKLSVRHCSTSIVHFGLGCPHFMPKFNDHQKPFGSQVFFVFGF